MKNARCGDKGAAWSRRLNGAYILWQLQSTGVTVTISVQQHVWVDGWGVIPIGGLSDVGPEQKYMNKAEHSLPHVIKRP